MHLHSASAAEPLAAALAEVLSVPPENPLSPEWLAVPSDGMRRWLGLELARHLGADGAADGVAANLIPAYPGRLRQAVLEAGRPAGEPDPWEVERLAWVVLDVLSQRAGDPLLAPLAAAGSPYGLARRVADLFDRYHVHRADMVRAWARGTSVDPAGQPLGQRRWQAHLWRLVHDALSIPSPPERLAELLGPLSAGQVVLDVPERLCFFGLTTLPGGADFLALAEAVAAHREVHLFLLQPSPGSTSELARRPAPSTLWRADDDASDLVGHPLVRSWGRLPRETVLLLQRAGRTMPDVLDLDRAQPEPVTPAGDTLLRHLQADVRSGRRPDGRFQPPPADRSVQFHACFGATRQVEVLRDALLHLLADPELGLREDDVVVLCPSLDRFAPLLEGVFGPSTDAPPTPEDGEQAPKLRYQVADRSLRAGNPMLAALEMLLALVNDRFDAPAVLDFLALPPVRLRFGLDDDVLGSLGRWAVETQVRWGLDAGHRVRFGLPEAYAANTWQAAVDRLLVGSAVADDGLVLSVGGVAPCGVEGDDVAAAGQLAEILDLLGRLAVEVTVARPVDQWLRLVADAVTHLLATPHDAPWQLDAVERALARVAECSGASSTPLSFADLRRSLAEQLEGPPGRAPFFRGGITVSSLRPLRWVPFKVVCLLGMDQAALGGGPVDGDDLAATAPWLGDPDQRAETRQALLEAVLAAGDRLLVFRDGHDVVTNQEVPMAVAVAELRDALAATVTPAALDDLRRQLEVAHPRQAFDEACFVDDDAAPVPGTVWSFDPAARAGALARRDRPTVDPPFVTRPLPDHDPGVIDLADLHRFLKNPVAAFFRQRLNVHLPRRENGPSALLPVEVGGLAKWQLGDGLLQARLHGQASGDWERVERQRGTVPPGPFGAMKLAAIALEVEPLLERARDLGYRAGPPERLQVEAELPDGTRVTGVVDGRLSGLHRGPIRVGYSQARGEHHLAAWLDLMALVTAEPAGPWRSIGIYRTPNAPKRNPTTVVDLVPCLPGSSTALQAVVDLYREGMTRPLPLFPKLSAKLAEGSAGPGDWEGYQGRGDRNDPAVALAFGRYTYAEVLGLNGGEALRLAYRLWDVVGASAVQMEAVQMVEDPT